MQSHLRGANFTHWRRSRAPEAGHLGKIGYDRLKRALRADIDEAAWSSLYSTVSRPFDKPESGKIAVKVINHYGDEVLKVYAVEKEKRR